jgi:hypothetical protein
MVSAKSQGDPIVLWIKFSLRDCWAPHSCQTTVMASRKRNAIGLDDAGMPPGLCGRPVLGCSLPGPRGVAGRRPDGRGMITMRRFQKFDVAISLVG